MQICWSTDQGSDWKNHPLPIGRSEESTVTELFKGQGSPGFGKAQLSKSLQPEKTSW